MRAASCTSTSLWRYSALFDMTLTAAFGTAATIGLEWETELDDSLRRVGAATQGEGACT